MVMEIITNNLRNFLLPRIREPYPVPRLSNYMVFVKNDLFSFNAYSFPLKMKDLSLILSKIASVISLLICFQTLC